MQRCFQEYCRVLKPGRWMTVVFHNSRNAVWNASRKPCRPPDSSWPTCRTLDRSNRAFRQVTSTAVKQDLIISAYRPNGGLEERFKLTAGTEEAVWDFVRTHLGNCRFSFPRTGRPKRLPNGKATCSSTEWWPSTSNAAFPFRCLPPNSIRAGPAVRRARRHVLFA